MLWIILQLETAQNFSVRDIVLIRLKLKWKKQLHCLLSRYIVLLDFHFSFDPVIERRARVHTHLPLKLIVLLYRWGCSVSNSDRSNPWRHRSQWRCMVVGRLVGAIVQDNMKKAKTKKTGSHFTSYFNADFT